MVMDYDDPNKLKVLFNKSCADNVMDEAACKHWLQSQRTIIREADMQEIQTDVSKIELLLPLHPHCEVSFFCNMLSSPHVEPKFSGHPMLGHHRSANSHKPQTCIEVKTYAGMILNDFAEGSSI